VKNPPIAASRGISGRAERRGIRSGGGFAAARISGAPSPVLDSTQRMARTRQFRCLIIPRPRPLSLSLPAFCRSRDRMQMKL